VKLLSILIIERIPQIIVLLTLFAIGYYFIYQGGKGKPLPKFRTIPALIAIEESVGRAAEMGRPVWYDSAYAVITGPLADQTYAGLSVLSYVAKLTARHNVPLFSTTGQVPTIALMQETIREAYIVEGHSEQFSIDMVNYMPVNAAILGKVLRERPAAAILVGAYMSDSITKAETANRIGAMVISGTATTHNIPFLFMCSDYTLIGEEIYAAGAILSQETDKIGSLIGEDAGKYIALVLIALGVIGVILGNDIIKILLLGG
jgi:hypothetical protein